MQNDTQAQNSSANDTTPTAPTTGGPITSSFTMDQSLPRDVSKTNDTTSAPSFSDPAAPVLKPGPPAGVTLTESAPVTAPPVTKFHISNDEPEPEHKEIEPVIPEHDTNDQLPTSDSSINDQPPTKDDASPIDTPTSDLSDDLLAIKQQALSQLQPLINHLDQTPEEKFKTLMMMIQAADDQSLLSKAYEAAEQISDEKQKAQALLDVVNEINYFTHSGQETDKND